MRLRFVDNLYLLIVFAALALPAAAHAFAGMVKTVAGDATVIRSGQTLPLAVGMEINGADVLKTGRHGRLGLIFSDDTLITMGPDTEIAIDDYLFEPDQKRLSFVMRLIHGTVSFLSGQIAKLSPESVRLVMPAATIGVRGTHVLMKVD